MLYSVMAYIPRHGFSEERLKQEILIFYACCFWTDQLFHSGIYIVRPSKKRIRKFFFKGI